MRTLIEVGLTILGSVVLCVPRKGREIKEEE